MLSLEEDFGVQANILKNISNYKILAKKKIRVKLWFAEGPPVSG